MTTIGNRRSPGMRRLALGLAVLLGGFVSAGAAENVPGKARSAGKLASDGGTAPDSGAPLKARVVRESGSSVSKQGELPLGAPSGGGGGGTLNYLTIQNGASDGANLSPATPGQTPPTSAASRAEVRSTQEFRKASEQFVATKRELIKRLRGASAEERVKIKEQLELNREKFATETMPLRLELQERLDEIRRDLKSRSKPVDAGAGDGGGRGRGRD